MKTPVLGKFRITGNFKDAFRMDTKKNQIGTIIYGSFWDQTLTYVVRSSHICISITYVLIQHGALSFGTLHVLYMFQFLII